MYFKLRQLKDAGVEVEVTKTELYLTASNHWTDEQIQLFRVFVDSIDLHDRDQDRVSNYISDLTIMRTLRMLTS